MTCEECRIAALDANSSGQPIDLAVARHLQTCPQCAVFQENWILLRQDLRDAGSDDRLLAAPPRIEMRLRHELREEHRLIRSSHVRTMASWALAAAAVLAAVIGFFFWEHSFNVNTARNRQQELSTPPPPAAAVSSDGNELGETIIASNSGEHFTVLPGAMPAMSDDATVVRVEMPRSALSTLGLSINEEHAGDLIQVDMLVSGDGQPQAVRLASSSD